MNTLDILLGIASLALVAWLILTKGPQKADKETAKPLAAKPVTVSRRKKYDTTPFTEEHIQKIHSFKAHFDSLNETLESKDKFTQADITYQLNQEFGLDKSITAYRRVWNNPPLINQE